jgi:transposase
VVLECAKGLDNKSVAELLSVGAGTVGKWRKRFIRLRLDGLLDAPRPGAPRRISDEKVEEVITKTLETMPRNATHWSTNKMAKAAGISPSCVGRIWRAFGLRPHRAEKFCLSNDPFLIEKVRDVAGLYMNPPANAIVLCVDEKSQIQALDRRQPLIPMSPGQSERGNYDYLRHGTTSLFAALDIATGRVIGKLYRQHRAREFLDFLRVIDKNVPEGLEIHVVIDNYSTHKTAEVRQWLARNPRFHMHFTPTHSSWLNLVECWFSILQRDKIERGIHTSVRKLEADIRDFIEKYNQNPRPFRWTRSADEILASMARFCERTLQNHGGKD